jgi:hypothetical protein
MNIEKQLKKGSVLFQHINTLIDGLERYKYEAESKGVIRDFYLTTDKICEIKQFMKEFELSCSH